MSPRKAKYFKRRGKVSSNSKVSEIIGEISQKTEPLEVDQDTSHTVTTNPAYIQLNSVELDIHDNDTILNY